MLSQGSLFTPGPGQTENMSFKNYKFKRLKEYLFSMISIIFILLVKNLYENGIIVEVFLRTFKHKLSLISLKQSQSVRLQQQFCQLQTSTVFYQVPDLTTVDKYRPPPSPYRLLLLSLCEPGLCWSWMTRAWGFCWRRATEVPCQ